MTRFMFSPFDSTGRPLWLRMLLALPLAMGLQSSYALDLGQNLQVHGFLTQGYVKTTDNRFFGDSDSKNGSFDYTELGVNASFRATPSILLAGQLLSRRAGDMYDGSPTVDFALVDWNISTSQDSDYGILVGRIKNPLGFYNETRDVAFTRPSIFLPQQVYFDKVRNLVLSSDGGQIHGEFYKPSGYWRVNFGIGSNTVDENVEFSYLGNDFGGDLKPKGVSYTGRVEYETPDGAWLMALSAARGSLAFDAGATDPIGSGDIDFLYWIASLQYNAERWSLTAEYMEEPTDFDGFGPLRDGGDSTVQGYYLLGSYLLRDNVELLVRYAEGFVDKHDRDGRKASAASGGLIPPHSLYQKDWMVGLRWDVTPNFMLRAEYQWNDGTWTLSPRENPVPGDTVKDWDMFSLLASYRF
ncbi:MAG: hypothetical protein WBN02_09390 [Sedimenticolaceae bacterium]